MVECTWKTVVLIPKRNGNFRGIGLVEVLWKTMLVVINQGIVELVQLHNILHGLRDGQGVGTVSLETKLLQQLM